MLNMKRLLLTFTLLGIACQSVTIHQRLPYLGDSGTLTITATQDSTAPEVTSFTCANPSANPRLGTDFVTCTAVTSDDLSQPDRMSVSFVNPSQFYYVTDECSQTSPNNFQCSLGFQLYSEVGMWTLANVFISDRAQNGRRYNNAEGRAKGWTADIYVNGTSDLEPPMLWQFTLDQTNVTAYNFQHDPVYFDANVTDNLSGCISVRARFVSPDGSYNFTFMSTTPYRGSSLNGLFEAGSSTTFSPLLLTMPSGYWTIHSVELQDRVGNARAYTNADLMQRGFAYRLYVVQRGSNIPPPIDQRAPELIKFSMGPNTVDVTQASKPVWFNFTAFDYENHLEVQAQLVSAAGRWLTVTINPTQLGVIVATIQGNTFIGRQAVFRNWEQPSGDYQVSSLWLKDQAGNRRIYGDCSPDTASICGPLNTATRIGTDTLVVTISLLFGLVLVALF